MFQKNREERTLPSRALRNIQKLLRDARHPSPIHDGVTGRTLVQSVTFGKRKSPPVDPQLAPPEPPIPMAGDGGRDASRAAIPEPCRSRTHYFTEPTHPAALECLEREIGASIQAGAAQITIVMTSPGGPLLPMLEVYRRLVALPVKIKTHAIGPVASAGTILMLAGSDRSADPRASFLFHPVSNPMQAQASGYEARSIERHRQLFELTLHNIYKERTRFSAQTIARFGREELVFSGQAAIECGIIHRIETWESKA